MEKQREGEKPLKSDKKQSQRLTGIALIIVGLLIIIIAVLQPKFNTTESKPTETESTHLPPVVALSDSDYSTSQQEAVAKINLNTCTAEDLMKIKGIGENKANAIIAYRNVLGSYSSVDEIKNISGFGDKLYESIKDFLTV